jgi:hypothetical protein
LLPATIDECDIRLSEIDTEMKKLQLERDCLLKCRSLLGGTTSEPTPYLAPRVLAIIEKNPGLTQSEIFEHLNEVSDSRKLTYCLTDLRRAGKIKKVSGSTRRAQWIINDAKEGEC